MVKQQLKNAEIDSVVLSLSLYCPTYCPNIEHSETCQLSETRKFSILQKTQWLKQITQNQKLAIFHKHQKCYSKNR